jgi:hypothetical protein
MQLNQVWQDLNPPVIYASGGQEPFWKRVPGPPKTFAWTIPGTLIFFVSLCVSSWLKLNGGFRKTPMVAKKKR